MKTEWNYDDLAEAYLKRPEYANDAISEMLNLAKLEDHGKICDIGAGVAHLTIPLALKGYKVNAIEPNDNMRKWGINRTKELKNVSWYEAVGEDTRQPSAYFDMVTFGSSFNVVDRQAALREVKRILKPNGWFAAMWNHRNLEDATQDQIEQIISSEVSGYNYGTRREDQTAIIDQSGLFERVIKIEREVIHLQSINEIVEAWRSHATLQRQAKDKFFKVINDIEKFLTKKFKTNDLIEIPYTTRIWTAQLK